MYPGLGWLVFRDRSCLPDSLVFKTQYLGSVQENFTLVRHVADVTDLQICWVRTSQNLLVHSCVTYNSIRARSELLQGRLVHRGAVLPVPAPGPKRVRGAACARAAASIACHLNRLPQR